MGLLDHFPATPRPEQEYVLKEIEKAFKSKEKYIIVQAPTGVGKSYIGATLALSTSSSPYVDLINCMHPQSCNTLKPESMYPWGAFVLTTTKQLQNQYEETFEYSSCLKGRENYICDLDPTADVSIAPCQYNNNQMNKCAKDKRCPYVEAYKEAMNNRFTELNYSVYFTLPEALKKKELLICDEASELEDKIISHFTLDIHYKLLSFLGVTHTQLKKLNPEDGFLWICDLNETLQGMSVSSPKSSTAIDIQKFKGVRNLREKVALLMRYWHSSEFIVEKTETGIRMMPLRANRLSRFMFEHADKIVFMSATIINPEAMAKSLGFRPSEFYFIDVPSTFDPKKSPIYISPAKYDMRFNAIDASLPRLVEDVLELCEIHKNDKGIIHTNSFKITEAFKNAVGNNPRFLIREDGVDNEVLLREHFERKDATVLISPSLAFGTSLDDEHGRFQVITKLPYLPMVDKRVKAISSKDFEWYQLKMWVKLIQMCGRCTRSKDDHSQTYIFDAGFIDALERYKNKLPKWFVNRLV